MSQLFVSGGQSIGASALVLPMNIQGLFPLGLTGLISLLSKGLSRIISSTTTWFLLVKIYLYIIAQNVVYLGECSLWAWEQCVFCCCWMKESVGFPADAVVKNLPANARDTGDMDRFDPWIRKISWSRKWLPAPVFLLRKFLGQTSLVHYHPWGHKVLDTTEWVITHVEFCQKLFIYICWDDCSCCDVSYWLICRYWTVLESLG